MLLVLVSKLDDWEVRCAARISNSPLARISHSADRFVLVSAAAGGLGFGLGQKVRKAAGGIPELGLVGRFCGTLRSPGAQGA